MKGDLADIASRLRAVLPKRWFGEQSPNLTAILQSISTPWVWLYGIIVYVIAQTRLTTATDSWLDIISFDFFGIGIGRKPNESDSNFRMRIKARLLQEAATRSAISSGLAELLGSRPVIFEPANCADTGSYGGTASGSAVPCSGMAYGILGGWGSVLLPLQFFITATRPATLGVGMLAGYGTANGGYGEGVISYVDLALLPGHISDQDIESSLCSLLPVNTIAWLRIN
jgi:hypothetical protein